MEHNPFFVSQYEVSQFELVQMFVESLAYIGPGAGISAIGALMALLGAIFLAMIGFLWFPMKRLYKKLRHGSSRTVEGERRESPAGDNTNNEENE